MRIGLIAMSGIRACDEELMRLGLTLPGFVERSQAIASLPSLGLLTLAGMTPRRHEVEYLEVPELRAMEELPDRFDLVAISSYSAQIGEAYDLGRRYRERGVPMVLGGPHVSCLPREAIESCDAVAIGEGESVWLQILHDAERGELRRFYGGLEGAFDLRDAPMPAFELLDIRKYNRLTVQTSRGCPHRCEFCAGSRLFCPTYKQKPKEKVLAEIDKIRDLWPHPFIEFADDNTFVHRAYWKELLPELARRKVRWFTETDISVAQDPELLRLMRESGCAEVLIGLESPTPAALNGLETRSNWKLWQFDHYVEFVHRIQSYGIRVNGCFVLGLDGQGPEVFDEVLASARQLELFDVQITLLTPFPGTPLRDRLAREGRLTYEGDWRRCTLFDVSFQPSQMSSEELARGFRELGVQLYGDELTQWRRSHFARTYKESLRARKEQAVA